MGAWGVGAFENDDGMDWLAELVASPDESVLLAAFNALPADTDAYIELPEASIALAAAEVVAAAIGALGPALPPEALVWVVAHRSTVSTTAIQAASVATKRVADGSELRELWEESESNSEWHEAVTSLQQRLVYSNV